MRIIYKKILFGQLLLLHHIRHSLIREEEGARDTIEMQRYGVRELTRCAKDYSESEPRMLLLVKLLTRLVVGLAGLRKLLRQVDLLSKQAMGN